MSKSEFNLDTLRHYLNSDDELDKQTAEMAIKDFKEYYQIVSTFDDKMNHWRETLSGEDYRREVAHLDTTRKYKHDDCISDIKMINKMAEADNLPVFAKTDNLDRRAIGNMIMQQTFDNITQNEILVNDVSKNRDQMNKYNQMFIFTKYPMVKDETGYHFADLFTMKKVDFNQVKTYVMQKTKDPEKLKILDESERFVMSQKPILNFDKLQSKGLVK